jgi:hypothetical protein
MQKNINKIELVLENCEVIVVEGKNIGQLDIGDIKYSIRRTACNYIDEMLSCEHFYLTINRAGNINSKTVWTLGESEQERNSFERIHRHPDITSAYIYFKDNDKPKQIYVPWDGESDYHNDAQKTYLNKFGDLFIVIEKDTKLEDVFDLEEIEHKGHMDFVWSMYE